MYEGAADKRFMTRFQYIIALLVWYICILPGIYLYNSQYRRSELLIYTAL